MGFVFESIFAKICFMEIARVRGLIHRRPAQGLEGDQYKRHRLVIPHSGDLPTGEANLFYFGNPFDFYYLSSLSVRGHRRGAGHGSRLIRAVNTFLTNRRRPGLLIDSIAEGSPAADLYDRNGWSPIHDREGWHGFNLPSNITTSQVRRAITRVEETLG